MRSNKEGQGRWGMRYKRGKRERTHERRTRRKSKGKKCFLKNTLEMRRTNFEEKKRSKGEKKKE